MQVQETIPTHVEHLLDTELQQHSALVQGQLSNGLKYVILPNAVPPERFEAHLEICAGRHEHRIRHICRLPAQADSVCAAFLTIRMQAS